MSRLVRIVGRVGVLKGFVVALGLLTVVAVPALAGHAVDNGDAEGEMFTSSADGALVDTSVTEQEVRIQAPDPQGAAEFARSVDLTGSDDAGFTVVAGEPGQDHVHVYRKPSDGNWNHTATLQGPAGSLFGFNVTIDGDTLAVLAPEASNLSERIQVFRFDGDTWQNTANLGRWINSTESNTTIPSTSTEQASIDLSGEHLIVGDPDANPSLLKGREGIAVAFNGHEGWNHTVLSGFVDDHEPTRWGFSVAVQVVEAARGDGDLSPHAYALVGDPCMDAEGSFLDFDCDQGTDGVGAWVLDDGSWSAIAFVDPYSDDEDNDAGFSVAISAFGTSTDLGSEHAALVGAPEAISSDPRGRLFATSSWGCRTSRRCGTCRRVRPWGARPGSGRRSGCTMVCPSSARPGTSRSRGPCRCGATGRSCSS